MILFKSTHFEYLYSGGTTERINLYFTFLKIAILDRRTTTINDKKTVNEKSFPESTQNAILVLSSKLFTVCVCN